MLSNRLKPLTCPAFLLVCSGLGFVSGCATESSRALETPTTQAAVRPYAGPRAAVVVGRFDNRSPYMRGIFSDGVDRLGGQAQTILITHLEQSGRFSVVDRDNMAEIAQEAQIGGMKQKLRAADFAISGDITEFGRKEVGDEELFGIAGNGKRQVAYAKVSVYLVNVRTSEVIFSAQGAGEYALDSREVLGFGSDASYDSTLNGKVLDLAIREAVDKLASGVEAGRLLNAAQ
jgi:curli biogenesis system outer membrane secretion channel CsgG